MKQFITRVYNEIVFNQETGTIIKKSKEKRLSDEISYYKKIKELTSNNGYRIDVFFPRFFNVNEHNSPYFLELEYFPFLNLGQILINKFDDVNWTAIVKQLNKILTIFSSLKISPGMEKNFSLDREKMFINKTITEYTLLKNQNKELNNLCSYNDLVINGKKYLNFEKIWPELEPRIRKLCNNNDFTIVHGDMCFSNILCGFDERKIPIIKFVDPRGSFGSEFGPYGDQIYDLAKLLHSLNGKYELIIYDKYDLFINDNQIHFSFGNLEERYKTILKIFDEEIFLNHNKKDILMIEGLIYVGMCARHYDSINRQKIMYSTGIKILNEVLE